MKNDRWLELTNGVCWSMLFSLAAIIMSIGALAGTHPRVLYSDDDKTVVLGFDYIGVIVGVLALLVTCLVAWNIWQTIDTKYTVKKAEEAAEKIQALEKKIERCKNIHRPYLAYSEGMRCFDAQKYSSAVHHFLSMAEMYVEYEIELNIFMQTAIDNVIFCIKKEPWEYKHRQFIDKVDNTVGRLRKLNNAVAPLDIQLGRIRKELEKMCEEKVPNPYLIQRPQSPTV